MNGGFGRKPEGKRLKYTIEMDLTEIGWDDVD